MPEDIIELEVLGEAARACDVLVKRVRGRVARRGATAADLSQYAASAFESYVETLLSALLAAASRHEGGDVDEWVRKQFHDGLESVGTPLRQAVSDSPHRHAVAQGLQQKMFEAEVMLRRALRVRVAQGPVLGGERPSDINEFRRKAVG